VRWSDLFDQRARLVAELEKTGTTIDYLLLDIQDVQDKGLQAELWQGGYDRDRWLRLALEWFGDLGNPQPQERSAWIGNDVNEPRIWSLAEAGRQPTFRTPDWARLPRLEADEAPEGPRAQVGGDRFRGITVPMALAEEAVRLHVRDGLGRRRLEVRLPGLGEWAARGTLYWYEVGKPAGLWLDEDNRLCWGPAITPVWKDREQRGHASAPTPVALRLPRP
jgi:hypothetical protein